MQEMKLKHLHKRNAIIAEAINEGLSITCSSAAPAVFFFLKKNGSIKSRSSVENLEGFSKGLESIFGFGSKVIEKKILKILCVKLQLPERVEIPDRFEFAEEVRKILKLCEVNRLEDRRIKTWKKN